MIKTTFYAILTCAAMLSGCSNGNKTAGEAVAKETETPAAKNDVRWKVNQEMKPHVRNGELALGEYQACADKDPKALAAKLEQHNNQLISSCTMSGPAHDALHEWLMPHLELVKDLKSAEDAKEAEPIIASLENSFSEYHKRFE